MYISLMRVMLNICYWPLFFNVSVQVHLLLFSCWIVCLIALYEFCIYSWYESFARFLYYEYFLPAHGLPSRSLNDVSQNWFSQFGRSPIDRFPFLKIVSIFCVLPKTSWFLDPRLFFARNFIVVAFMSGQWSIWINFCI